MNGRTHMALLQTCLYASMERMQERVLKVWKKWFLKVQSPAWSTGMPRPQDMLEMKIARGKVRFCKYVEIPAGRRLIVQKIFYILYLSF